MRWIFDNARRVFSRHRSMWNEVNRAHGNSVLLDAVFIDRLLDRHDAKEALLGVSTDSRRPGFVLVGPIGKGLWQTFQPSQAPIGLILAGNPNDLFEQMQALIRALPGYALGCSVLQQDPDHTAFRHVNVPHWETVPYIETARLTVSGTFEDYWTSRGKNLTHNLSRQYRRLKEQGIPLECSVVRDPGLMAGCVKEFGELEATGWKGAEGTAVTADNAQGALYRELLEGFSAQGEAVVYRLILDGRVIACDLCVERDQTIVILKTAYDEQVKGLSPGLLLHREVFQALFFEQRIKTVEFYGRVRDWHMKWTNDVRTMFHVNCYRHRAIAMARRLVKAMTGRVAGP